MEEKNSWNGWPFISVLCAGVILTSFFMPLSALPRKSVCWFYNLTHIPCPGCGLTRAFICISHGDWTQAAHLNPFCFVWYFLALYFLLRPFFLKYFSLLSKPMDKLIKSYFFFPSLVFSMFLVWGWRIYPQIHGN